MLTLISTHMAMECNIDSKGRVVRFITGIFAILAGFVLAILVSQGILTSESYMLVIIGSILGVAFALWEARAGWCIVRAMGFKTPL